jgi:hypothetical protein
MWVQLIFLFTFPYFEKINGGLSDHIPSPSLLGSGLVKHIPMVMNTHTTAEELFDMVFFMQSMSV